MKYNEDTKKQSPIRKSRSRNLILKKTNTGIPANTLSGEVVSIIGKTIIVRAIVDGLLVDVTCVKSGAIISSSEYSNIVAIGDRVHFIYYRDSLSKIVAIEDRTTKFSRCDPSNRKRELIIAANVDTLVIFVSAVLPAINPRFIDRYLVAAKVSKIKPIICINKIDLINKSKLYPITTHYNKLGFKVHFISVTENIGIEKITKFLSKRRAVITGPSGSGKSSFLNLILNTNIQDTSEVSVRTNKGTHTTSFSRRFELSDSGWIVDTPGIREFSIWDVTKDEIGVLFPDFEKYFLQCKFTSCTHTNEPGCAVIKALEDGLVAEERYISYLNIYDTLDRF